MATTLHPLVPRSIATGDADGRTLFFTTIVAAGYIEMQVKGASLPGTSAYDLAPNGAVDLASERVFFSFPHEGEGSPDGMKVDVEGNVYCGGPNGRWIIGADSTPLATIVAGPHHINNIALGGDDWRTLYFCSCSSLFRIRLLTAGLPVPKISAK